MVTAKHWKTKSFHGMRRMAELMDVPLKDAFSARLAALKRELTDIRNYSPKNATNRKYQKLLIAQKSAEISKLVFDYNSWNNAVSSGMSTFTEAEVQIARNFPVNFLVSFGTNGYARAICHEEKTGSMHFIGPHAFCFACNRSLNAIDIIMMRDGLDFAPAVTKLLELSKRYGMID